MRAIAEDGPETIFLSGRKKFPTTELFSARQRRRMDSVTYTVREPPILKAGGIEALALCTADPGHFELPATDQTMSGVWERPTCADRGLMSGWYGSVWDEILEK